MTIEIPPHSLEDLVNSSMVFGNGLQYAKSLTFQSTTSTILQQALAITTPMIPAGDYLIAWQYLWSLDATNENFIGEAQINGTPITRHVQQPASAAGVGAGGTDQRHQLSGWSVETLTNAVHTIRIMYATSMGAEAAIHQCRLVIWRVG